MNTYQLVPLARLDIERVRTTLQQPLTVKHVAKAGVGAAARLLPTLALPLATGGGLCSIIRPAMIA